MRSRQPVPFLLLTAVVAMGAAPAAAQSASDVVAEGSAESSSPGEVSAEPARDEEEDAAEARAEESVAQDEVARLEAEESGEGEEDHADEDEDEDEDEDDDEDDDDEHADQPELAFAPLAYVEMFFLWSFNEPSNGVVAFRGFDNRHASFTLANAALGARLAYDRIYGVVVLQWGHTPASYYAAEPSVPAAAGVGASDADLWRVLQQAYFGWNLPVLERGLRIEGGLFLSPVGIEGMAIADNWNFSRSNLFFGLPFYHTGLRATLPLDEAWSVTAMACNGWNTILDNNDEKSVHAAVSYSTDPFAATLLYFGGVERGPAEPERGWRNLFDLTARVSPAPWIEVQAQVDVGFEPWSDATHVWFASALYARVRPIEWLDVALRGDFFWDGAPRDSSGARRSPIFWPAEWVSSATATVTFRPLPQLMFRIEYRHDEAASETFFAGDVAQSALGEPILDAVRQDTLTFGAVAYLR